MVNMTYCYLLIVSINSFVFYSLAIGPGGEEESSDEQQHQQQLPFPTNPGGLSAAAKPFHPKEQHPRSSSSVPTRPQQQHFPPPQQTHQITITSLLRPHPPFIPWNYPQYITHPGKQYFPARGMLNFPHQGVQHFPSQEPAQVPLQQRANYPPQQAQRQSVPNDLTAIAAENDKNNNNNNVPVVQIDSTSLGTSSSGNPANVNSRGWHIWNFESPEIKHLTSEQWTQYLQPTEHFFPLGGVVDVAGLKLMPSDMAKEISPDKRVGIALFREGIVPFGTHPTCRKGGFFHMSFLTSTGEGNRDKLAKIDQIFQSFVSLALLELPPNLKSEVRGIFLGANIYVVRKPTEHYNNNNPEDLPCRFVFELWIRNKHQQNKFRNVLNNQWNMKQMKKHRIPVEKFEFKRN